jgi:tetratricopeptide (TPR) repeat protein
MEPGNLPQRRSHYETFMLGVIHYNMNDLVKAEEEFKETIKISPYFVDAYYNLGLLYNQNQRFPEAGAVLEKALLLDPDDAAVHFELGIAYKGTLDMEAARKEFNLALTKINRWRAQDRAIIQKELAGIKR